MTNPKGGRTASGKGPTSGAKFGARSFTGTFSKWASSTQARGGSGFETERLEDPYRQESRVYACVNKWAEALASVQCLRLYRRDAGEEVEVTDHPILDLLRDVNPQDSFADHQDQIGRHLALVGEHLILMADVNGDPILDDADPSAKLPMPVALWPKMGGDNAVRAVCSPDTNRLVGWELLGARTRKVWPASSALMLKLRRPGSRFRGLGPMGAAFNIAAQNYIARRYQDGLLRTGGDPGGTIEVPEILGEVEYSRLQDEVEESWNNPDRAGETRLLEGGASYKPNSIKPRDMGYERLLAANKKDIAETFGVPDALLGMGTSNYATFLGEERVFWRLTILPKLRLTENLLNERFLPRIEGCEGMYVRYDLSDIEPLQGDLEQQAKDAKALQGLGVPLKVAMQEAGLVLEDEIPGSEVPLVASGLQRLDSLVGGESGDDSGGAGDERTADPSATLNGAQIKSLVDLITSVRQGSLPRASALEIIVASFPFTTERAEKILGAIQEGEAPPPPPTPPPGAPPLPLEDDATDGERALHCRAVTRSLESHEGRLEAWKAVREPLDSLEDRTTRELRRVFDRMRATTLDRITAYAESGVVGELAAPIYSGEPPAISSRTAAALAKSWLGAPTRTVELRASCGCSFRALHAAPEFERAAEAAGLEVEAAERAAQLAVLRTITEAEIDRLVAALDAEFQDELARVLEDGTSASIEVADRAILAELERAGFVGVGDPQLIVNLRDKAILVAEGSSSVTAQQVRAAIIRSIGSSMSDITNLQDALVANLEGVRTEVNRAYGMSSSRARTIARTEIGQVSSEVRDVRMRESEAAGYTDGRVWSAAVPSDQAPPYEDGGFVRSEHWQMDGERRAPGQPWIMPDGTRMARVRDYGAPAHQVINCRCEELATFPEDLEAIWSGEAEPDDFPTT